MQQTICHLYEHCTLRLFINRLLHDDDYLAAMSTIHCWYWQTESCNLWVKQYFVWKWRTKVFHFRIENMLRNYPRKCSIVLTSIWSAFRIQESMRNTKSFIIQLSFKQETGGLCMTQHIKCWFLFNSLTELLILALSSCWYKDQSEKNASFLSCSS